MVLKTATIKLMASILKLMEIIMIKVNKRLMENHRLMVITKLAINLLKERRIFETIMTSSLKLLTDIMLNE